MISEYFFTIISYLRDMINSNKVWIRDFNGIIIEDELVGEWKIQLIMRINFIYSLDPKRNLVMDSKSDNVEITMGN